jgi:GDPmannose 4,6-dehydratase
MPGNALITGITGQDGSYLAELLLSKGYKVYGLVRRLSRPNLTNIKDVLPRITLIDGDLADQGSLNAAVVRSQPEEVYNLGAQSFVGASFSQPELTVDITGLGTLRLLEAVRKHAPNARFYQASSSEMFGAVNTILQNENTPFHPRSPYGAAKVLAHHIAVNYREAYGMFVVSGIAYNHESPRRGIEFVTRTITHGVTQINKGLADHISLATLTPLRDWGYAPEYVEGFWRSLNKNHKPEDYVFATGENHSVGEFAAEAFKYIDIEDWEPYVRPTNLTARPSDVMNLCGDYKKARRLLDWEPLTRFKALVRLMMEAEK